MFLIHLNDSNTEIHFFNATLTVIVRKSFNTRHFSDSSIAAMGYNVSRSNIPEKKPNTEQTIMQPLKASNNNSIESEFL